jgi:pyruvate,water dikinase
VGIIKRMMSGAVERWTEEGRPAYVAVVEGWQVRQWRELPSTELLGAVRELSEAAIDAYGSLVSGVIPAAWMSEALFTIVYKTFIKRRNDPPAPAFLLGFNSIPIRAEKDLFDLARWAAEQKRLAGYLQDTPAAKLAAQIDGGKVPEGMEQDAWLEWRRRFRSHLSSYGHTIYDLDFASPVPADDPAPLLETFKMFLTSDGTDYRDGMGTDPHQRQQASAERREKAMQAMLQRLKGLRLRLFRKTVGPAQRFAPLREDGLAEVGLSYPLLRRMLRELGRRLVDGGMIEEDDDIFWLKEDEVEEAVTLLDGGQRPSCLAAEIRDRKATWHAARRVTPPMMLPQVRVLGRDLEAVKAARAGKRSGDTLKGVATSPGRVTAPACVLRGPEDFGQMRTGDVLVAAVTTPAWTPLFVRAAAVVTDVGGPLSHGSIVAREYGIPAVLGTGTATGRIRSGQMITVDGGEGKVYLTADSAHHRSTQKT